LSEEAGSHSLTLGRRLITQLVEKLLSAIIVCMFVRFAVLLSVYLGSLEGAEIAHGKRAARAR
jgi:hypothetical protein